jgi:competence protein ComEC
MKQPLFYCVVTGFIIGIVIHSVIPVASSYGLFSMLVSIALLFVSKNRHRWFVYSCVILLGIGIGLVRYEWFVSWKGDALLQALVDEKVILEGVIVEEPAAKEKYTKLIVAVGTVNDTPIHKTKIIVQDGTYSERTYGDRIRIEGKVSKPKNIEREGERSFDYVSYLGKDKIFYEVKYAKVSILQTHQGNKIMQVVYVLKAKATSAIEQVIPFPESTLGTGVVVAGKGALPKNVQDAFQRTGTIQVVVLSGYNVTLVGEVIIFLCARLPLFLGVSISAVMIVLFSLAAGGSATIMRAVVMVIVALGAKLIRREYNVVRALIISGVVMLFFNPMLLVFDPSFQLSFLATIGLIFATPLASAKLKWVTERGGLREMLASGIATQMFLTPFLIFLTGEVSLVSVPANLAVGVFVPLAMLASFITALVGSVSLTLAMPFGIIAFGFLKTILTIVHIFSIIPFASLTAGSLPFWVTAGCYGIFTIVIVQFYRKEKTKQT